VGGDPCGPAPTYGAPLCTTHRVPSSCILPPPHSPQLEDSSRFTTAPAAVGTRHWPLASEPSVTVPLARQDRVVGSRGVPQG